MTLTNVPSSIWLGKKFSISQHDKPNKCKIKLEKKNVVLKNNECNENKN